LAINLILSTIDPIAGPGNDPGCWPYESQSGTCPACHEATSDQPRAASF
jgi:hypothetical protein